MSYSWNRHAESYPQYLARRSILNEQLSGISKIAERTASEITTEISTAVRDSLTANPATLASDYLWLNAAAKGHLEGDLRRVSDSVESLGSMIDSRFDDLVNLLDNGFGHIGFLLSDGFAALLHDLEEIRSEIGKLIHLTQFEEQRKATENFAYAVFAMNRQLWDETLEYIDAAISGDKHSKGYKMEWRFHWLKGELLLGAPSRAKWDGLNPEAAERAFLLAARYSKNDAPVESGKSLIMASVAAHCQSPNVPAKLGDMLRHALAAYEMQPNQPLISFQVAKAYMALDVPDEALTYLRIAIDLDLSIIFAAAEDPDFVRYGTRLTGFLDAFRNETLKGLLEQTELGTAALSHFLEECSSLHTLPEIARISGVQDGKLRLVDLLRYKLGDFRSDLEFVRTLGQRLQRERAAARHSLPQFQQHLEKCPDLQRLPAARRIQALAEGPLAGTWSPAALARYGEDEHFGVANDISEVRSELKAQSDTTWFDLRISTASTSASGKGVREQHTIELALLNGLGQLEIRHAFSSMIRIEAGEFVMGVTGKMGFAWEQPAHKVTLTVPFAIATRPVSKIEFAMVSSYGNFRQISGAGAAARGNTWLSAVHFCNSLSRAAGLKEAYRINGSSVSWEGPRSEGFRLPTEAEWEYSQHCIGDFFDKETVPEWCWDWFGAYSSASLVDPIGPRSGDERVVRGERRYAAFSRSSAPPDESWDMTRQDRESGRDRSPSVEKEFGFRIVRSMMSSDASVLSTTPRSGPRAHRNLSRFMGSGRRY